MTPRLRTFLPLLAALVCAGVVQRPARGAVDISAEVDKTELSVGERVTYTVNVTGNGNLPDIDPPEFTGFEVLMGPATSTNIQMINGRVSQSKSWSWVLRALKPGLLTIDPARARVRRKTYSTQPVTLTVYRGSSSGNEAEPVVPGRRRGSKPPEVFLTARADKDTVFLQEMLTVTYRLYLRVNVSSYDVVKQPQATGFWQEEFRMPSQPALQNVTIRGEPYKVAVIKKTALFPTRTGTLEVEPLTLDVGVERPLQRRPRDPFNWFFDDPLFSRTRREIKTVSSDPLKVAVLELPAGRPAAFRGDVGDFQLRVTYDKRQLQQHDALTVKVTVSGSGYLKSVDPPKLNLPSGFEQFDPTVDERVSLTGGAMRGSKVFTYLVIPRRAGEFRLPPVSLAYFNPDDRAYRTLKAGGWSLAVTPAAGGDIAGYGAGPAEVTLMDSDIRFIKDIGAPLTKAAPPPYNSIWFYAAIAVWPLLFLAGLGTEAAATRRASDRDRMRRRQAPERFRKALKSAVKLTAGGDGRGAVELLAREFAEFVAAVIRKPTAGLTGDEIQKGLEEAGAGTELVSEVLSLLRFADMVRFSGAAGIPGDKFQQVLEQFRDAAKRLDKLRSLQ